MKRFNSKKSIENVTRFLELDISKEAPRNTCSRYERCPQLKQYIKRHSNIIHKLDEESTLYTDKICNCYPSFCELR